VYDDLPERLQEIVDDNLDYYIYRYVHKPISDNNIKLLRVFISPFINGRGRDVSRCLTKSGSNWFSECSWCGEWKSRYNSCKCHKNGLEDSFTPTNYFILKHILKDGEAEWDEGEQWDEQEGAHRTNDGKYRAVPFSYVCEPGRCDNHSHVLRLYPDAPNGIICNGCDQYIKGVPFWHCDTCHDNVLGRETHTFIKFGFDLCQHCNNNPDTWNPESDVEHHESSEEQYPEAYSSEEDSE
jgi:hypothetical protein